MLGELLERRDVTEELTLRSSFGFMAYHGGTLERTTDTIARVAAERAGASYYGVVQRAGEPVHIPSIEVSPDDSNLLARFLDRVDVVITVHGYGRDEMWEAVLVGGRNRELAHHVATHARPALPRFMFETDLDRIPKGLRGQHHDNPVNLPPKHGVQLELPPPLRWHHEQEGWSDHGDTGRVPQVDILIDVLVSAVDTWRP